MPLNAASRCSSLPCRLHVAGDQARRAGAGPVALGRRRGGLADARVVGEAEVVVRAEQQDLGAVEQRRAAPAAPRPAAGGDEAQRARSSASLARTSSTAASRPSRRLLGATLALARARGIGRHLALLLDHPKLGRGIPEVGFGLAVDELVDRRVRRLAVEPAGAVVGPRVGAVVVLARHVQPELLEHRAVVGGLGAERRQEVAHHHAVQPGLDGQRLQVAEVLDAAAAEAEQGAREDQPEDRDPLDDLPGIHQLAVAELRAGPRVQQVDRHRGGIDLGQLERHLDALARRLAEVEDAADAGLEPSLLAPPGSCAGAPRSGRWSRPRRSRSAPSRRCGGPAGRRPP